MVAITKNMHDKVTLACLCVQLLLAIDNCSKRKGRKLATIQWSQCKNTKQPFTLVPSSSVGVGRPWRVIQHRKLSTATKREYLVTFVIATIASTVEC